MPHEPTKSRKSGANLFFFIFRVTLCRIEKTKGVSPAAAGAALFPVRTSGEKARMETRHYAGLPRRSGLKDGKVKAGATSSSSSSSSNTTLPRQCGSWRSLQRVVDNGLRGSRRQQPPWLASPTASVARIAATAS
jgi:hypothetical protein